MISISNKHRIILASKSPRRAKILRMIGMNFKIFPSSALEEINQNIGKSKIAESISKKKAKEISIQFPNDIIIGADTIVVSHGEIFEKPKDIIESKKMLKTLSGSSHKVITGVTLINESLGAINTFSETTEVFFKKIPEKQIEYYTNNYNPLDKAGSYGIQEWSSVWIKKINGCYYNVMGLPISKFYERFIKFEKSIN